MTLPESVVGRRWLRRRRTAPTIGQPLEMSHPRSREASLYVSQRTVGIEGLDLKESKRLVRDLVDHVVRPDNVVSHAWRPGELILYDNVLTLHRSDPFEGPRLIKVARFELG